MQLHRRGFFPKGGGRAELTVHSLELGTPLQAINLTDRGDITCITVSAFQAGLMKPDVAQRMASAAGATLQKVMNPAALQNCFLDAFRITGEKAVNPDWLSDMLLHALSNETIPHACAALAASSGAAQKHITGIQRAGSGQWCGHLTDCRHLSRAHLGGVRAPGEGPAT